jgi:hypothetical protein
LHEVSLAIASQPNLRAVLQSLRRLLSNVVPFDSASLSLLCGNGNSVRLIAFDRSPEAHRVEIGTEVQHLGTAVGKAIDEQKPISINLWTQRLIATSNTATLLAGMALIGLTTILPIYVQGVLGRTPIEAGGTLTTLVFGWPLAVMMSGRLYRMFGIRTTARVGSFIFPLGALFLLFPDLTQRPRAGECGVLPDGIRDGHH